LVGDITDWIPDTDTARRPTRVLAWGLETDFYGSQLLIHKLVTATVTATVTAAIAATVDTARRRRRRSIDLAAAATVIATAAPVIAATGAHRAKERGTEQRRSKEEAKCFGLGRNGGGSECESCSGHDGYPA
jgi:hypothetical protein